MTMNQQIHLMSRPDGEARVDNFKLLEAEVPELRDGQVLVRHHFMSLDPYMRGRMNDAKSYAVPQPLNAVMQGGTVGEVVASKNPGYAVGDQVVGFGGWQQFSVVDANTPGVLRKVDTTHIPLSAYLGAVGMPGVTAWYGLLRVCEPRVAAIRMPSPTGMIVAVRKGSRVVRKAREPGDRRGLTGVPRSADSASK